MSLYLFLYFMVIIFLFYIGILFYLKNRKYLFGFYFLLSMFFYGFWLFLYLISFTTTYDSDLLLILSRMLYSFSLIAGYSMLMFLYFYGNKNIKLNSIFNLIVIILFICIFILLNFSSFVIEKMTYDISLNLYYESFGVLYFIYGFLSFILPFLYLYFLLKRSMSLRGISKIRFLYISVGFFVLGLLEWFFLGILPLFGVRLFQKEQILFFIPFLFSVWYSVYRYNFLDLKIILSKVLNFFISVLLSLILLSSLSYYFLGSLDVRLVSFWGISEGNLVIELILGIIFFNIFYKLFEKYIFLNIKYIEFRKILTKIEKKVAYITNINSLNNYLDKEFKSSFKINFVRVSIFDKKEENLIKNYFEKNRSYNFFINDVVFIEENKNNFNYDLLKNDLKVGSYIIFPLFDNKLNFIGIFEIGKKYLNDVYTKQELELLKSFVEFLSGHLKYIEIYKNINDLNINLDKKVDEKTIEYNQLINKQTEFISMASHEIKGSLSSLLIQTDYITDYLDFGKNSVKDLKKEIYLLGDLLGKISSLVNNIFSVQRFDLEKINLYKQKLNLYDFIEDILEKHSILNKNVQFLKSIDKNLGYINLDKIYFTQVFDNLITNAVKYTSNNGAKIHLKVKKVENNIVIQLEDNGVGFKPGEDKQIFEKYNTLNGESIGIGMGLYLCKKIVEMHEGTIKAKNSKILGGANFVIIIPIK